MSKTCNDIRREFIEFFEKRDHRMIHSSSLLSANDATLLFANAGMNQFKPIFLGTETRDYTRAVNTQKCIRAGGKHNDLEDVGRDCYHHTFFEMLGNWSFGDYFKEDAIRWAWTLLTEVWQLPKDRLHATVFEGDPADGLDPDEDARKLWQRVTDIDPSHIHDGNTKDNFWEMGETGPCGPCSEIHIDLTPMKSGADLVNAGDARVIEIWNLVFIQFNRDASGTLAPLPAQHVDTGMGLERICAVLQGKKSNYATDLFTPIIEQVETLTQHVYGSDSDLPDRFDVTDETRLGDVAMRVIADHIRTLTFAITDGILPGNEGRGYVLRSVLRRAAGFGRQHLGIEGEFLHTLVPTVVKMMKDAFPELAKREAYVIETIRGEEESFGETLDRGLQLFEKTVETVRQNGGREISGEDAFELHATYGFPITLTTLMAEKSGLRVDEAGYEEAMERHRETSSAGSDSKFKADAVVGLPATDDSAKFTEESVGATVQGWVKDDRYVTDGELTENDQAGLVLDKTNFYGESGGQIGDIGTIMGDMGVFVVEDTQLAGQCVLHVGYVKRGRVRPGDMVNTSLCECRMDTMRNHSATHMLNWALRKVLDPEGESLNQAGSVVDDERLRFDFTHNRAVSPEQLARVEKHVNDFVLADAEITAEFMPLDEARKLPGARAVFGEKYPDPVRVITMGGEGGPTCVEFCGGTHLSRTIQVGAFKIVGEESVAKGIRRITAVTGRKAVEWMQTAEEVLRETGATLRTAMDEIPARVAAMQKEIKDLRKRPATAAAPAGVAGEETLETAAGKVVIGQCPVPDPGAMRNLCDQQRQKGAVAVFIGAADAEEGKVMLTAMVDDELARSGKIRAGDWVKAVAPVVGGGGGGKPTLAQAGGKQPDKLPDALAAAKDFAAEKLG
ncbi:MAG: alanine--tRNA ligase [Planctomycetes bacterium]|jgi:alanyl-tRNA synthetase|nr:alanine--tRNA ligase [Phycisphaerae bacterium]NBB95309.1 alanine--tRNA ligase [Planctomycetota bacterium]